MPLEHLAVLGMLDCPLAREADLREDLRRCVRLAQRLRDDDQAGLRSAGDGDERSGHLRPEPSPLEPVERVVGDLDAPTEGRRLERTLADLRPAGLRWRPTRRLCVAFDPLSLAIVAPVLGSPGIVQLEYRTLLGVELLP